MISCLFHRREKRTDNTLFVSWNRANEKRGGWKERAETAQYLYFPPFVLPPKINSKIEKCNENFVRSIFSIFLALTFYNRWSSIINPIFISCEIHQIRIVIRTGDSRECNYIFSLSMLILISITLVRFTAAGRKKVSLSFNDRQV